MKKAWSLAMPYIQIAKIVILFNAHNNSFDWFLAGITGAVRIDDNGDRDADYSLLDLDPVTGRFEVVSHYYGANRWVRWHPFVASQIIQIQFGNQELGISSEQTWVEFKLVFIFALTLWLDSQISTGQDRTMDRRRTCRSVDSWGTTHSVRAMVLKLNLCTSHSMVKSATFSCWVCFLSLRLAASFSYFITFIANKSGLDYDFMCLFVCLLAWDVSRSAKSKFPLQSKNANQSLDSSETVIVYGVLSFALLAAFISSLSYLFYK